MVHRYVSMRRKLKLHRDVVSSCAPGYKIYNSECSEQHFMGTLKMNSMICPYIQQLLAPCPRQMLCGHEMLRLYLDGSLRLYGLQTRHLGKTNVLGTSACDAQNRVTALYLYETAATTFSRHVLCGQRVMLHCCSDQGLQCVCVIKHSLYNALA